MGTQIAKFMGPVGLSASDGPHVGPMNLAFRVVTKRFNVCDIDPFNITRVKDTVLGMNFIGCIIRLVLYITITS